MMWNNAPCHHTKKNHYSILFYFPFDHGVTYCIFVITCCDKFRCHEFLFFKKNCQQKGFDAICHDVHVCKQHLYEIC